MLELCELINGSLWPAWATINAIITKIPNSFGFFIRIVR